MTEQKTTFDFEVLRRAIEGSDAEALISLYADDAELRVVNKNTPPSISCLRRGKEAIAGLWRDVCAREMTHRIENEIIGEDRVSFNEACEYPDGTRVLSAMTLDLRDGKIARQVNVEVWDE